MALTRKQQAFIEAYFTYGMNATRAAIEAGYSEDSAAVIGWENLRKPEIREEVERRFKELIPSGDEVLTRLAEHARGDIGELWDENSGQIDWKKARAEGKTHLIRKIRHKTITTTDKDGNGTEILEDEIELHDQQKALQLIGKYRKLFVERTEISGIDGKPIEVKAYSNFNPDDWDNSPES